jgi:MFS transporter, NNP family, nitrate/nitrite transporter
VTLAVFGGVAVATAAAIAGVHQHSFPLFFGAFMAVFLLAGMGNGSTYRMIPAIFAALGVPDHKHQAAAVIGIAGAIGAFGGFLIQVVLRQASLSAQPDWPVPALWAFLGAYVFFAGVTWFFYLRRRVATHRIPSLAYASV